MKRAIITLAPLLFLGCYAFDLVVNKENAYLYIRPVSYDQLKENIDKDRHPRSAVKIPPGSRLKNLGKSKGFWFKHWYKVKYEPIDKDAKPGSARTGYIYRDFVKRAHHNRTIYNKTYKNKDNLALMLTWPAVIIGISVWLGSSKTRLVNIFLAIALLWVMLVQTVYIVAKDSGRHRYNSDNFRRMGKKIKELNENKKIFVYFTDITWAARAEVMSEFSLHFDRFSKDHDYNKDARMRALTAKRGLSGLHGVYILTDPRYYNTHTNWWALPQSLYDKNFPSNWSLVYRTGSARLFYAR